MPHLCICNLKVDRLQNKLICVLCHQLFHPECCNVKESELDFVKNNYKCAKCLSNRRLSLSNESNDLSVKLHSYKSNTPAEGEDGSVISDDIASLATANTGTANNAANGANDLPAHTGALACPDLATSTQSADRVVVNEHVLNTSGDLLNSNFMLIDKNLIHSILTELTAVRKANVDLHDLVSSLRSENSLILSLLEEIKCNQLTKSLDKGTPPVPVLSPKRKKQKTTKITPVSVNNADDFPLLMSSTSCVPTYANVLRPTPANSSTNEAVNGAYSNVWTTVATKNHKTNSHKGNPAKKPLVVGVSNNNDLNVIDKKRWLHLSSFKTTVSTDDVLSFVEKTFDISKLHMSCFKLVKKGTNVNDLRFVNFKLGVSACFAHKLFDASLWPANIKIRDFDFLEKKIETNQL